MTVNPQYSIDVSSLGGIEANSISMVGNNIGFGVRNKGSIISNGTLMLTSNGNLLNKGSITGKGLLSQFPPSRASPMTVASPAPII